MADIHRLPNIRNVEREASEWIARLEADDCSAEDRARFESWLHAHPLHARTHEEMLGTLRQFKNAAPLSRDLAPASSASRGGAAHGSQRWRWLATAAAVIVAAVALGFHLHALTTKATFVTALGERATVTLPDGSTVQLNSGSRVRVDYSLRSRVVYLERGEAFFNVAHNASRPFWVASGKGWVRAVGTAFDVYLNAKGVRVVVSEGAVKVGTGERLPSPAVSGKTVENGSTLLAAGEQADVEGNVTRTRKLSTQELARASAWQSGWLFFENDSLCDVVTEMGRYTPRQLVMEDERLCSLSVGGAFQANPEGADSLLSMLEQNFGARIRRDNDRDYIRGAALP